MQTPRFYSWAQSLTKDEATPYPRALPSKVRETAMQIHFVCVCVLCHPVIDADKRARTRFSRALALRNRVLQKALIGDRWAVKGGQIVCESARGLFVHPACYTNLIGRCFTVMATQSLCKALQTKVQGCPFSLLLILKLNRAMTALHMKRSRLKTKQMHGCCLLACCMPALCCVCVWCFTTNCL